MALVKEFLEDNGCKYALAVVQACFDENEVTCAHCPFPLCIKNPLPTGYIFTEGEIASYTQGYIDGTLKYYPLGIAEGFRANEG